MSLESDTSSLLLPFPPVNPASGSRSNPSTQPKCVRWWHLRSDVGSDPRHPELCARCVINVEGPGEERQFALTIEEKRGTAVSWLFLSAFVVLADQVSAQDLHLSGISWEFEFVRILPILDITFA